MEPQKIYARLGTPDCPISVSFATSRPNALKIPHYHAYIEIVRINEGEAIFLVDGEEMHLFAGSILVLTPGQVHRCVRAPKGIRMCFLCFSPELICAQDGNVFQEEFVKPLQAGLLRLPQLLQEGHPAYDQVILALEWLQYCSSMLKPNYKAMRYTMAIGICSALLPWCTQPTMEHTTVDSDNVTVQQVMSFIRRNYLQPLDLQAIAQEVHLHPNYLCALFKKHTGKTVMYHLDRTRIDTAIYLLENSQLTMSHIAERSGYRDESAFYYKFRKFTGMTPAQWRGAHSTR